MPTATKTSEEHLVIQDDHKKALARYEHVLLWLQGEKARLEAELGHIMEQGQRMQSQLETILLQQYGVTPGTPYQMDTDAGRITVPHAEPAPAPAEAEAHPEDDPAPAPATSAKPASLAQARELRDHKRPIGRK